MVTALPPAAAILVFGVIYGSLSAPRIGSVATIVSSLLIFSGAVQFTITALLASGAGATAVLAGAMTLNLRNVVLGAVISPRIEGGPVRRGALAWFLTDEAAGLALASGAGAASVLLVAGSMFYVSWQIGTILGVVGASLDGLRDAAAAVFPVLFVGLAAVACTSWSIAVRAGVAAIAAGLAAWLAPGSEAIAAVVAGIAVSIPGREQ